MAIICFTGHILVCYVFQICGFVIVVVSMYFIYVFPFDIEKRERERVCGVGRCGKKGRIWKG